MDDVSKLFIDDLYVDGMLHCIALRSRIRRGAIREIIRPGLPPNVTMIRAADLTNNLISIGGADLPILAENNVEHPGQAIALLCGDDELQLQRLAERIEIQYNRGDPFSLTRDYKIDQELYTRRLSVGNTSAAFEKASHITEGAYRYEPPGRSFASPCGALAIVTDGGIQIAAPAIWAFHVRDAVARAMGMDRDAVQVKCTRVTRGDPNTLWYASLTAAQAAAASLITGRPVRMIASAGEKRRLFTRRAGCIISHRTALSPSGEITAMEIQIVSESGAFGMFAAEYLDRMCLAAVGNYAAKALKIEGVHIKTSTPPADLFGAIGFDGGFFAMEVHASRLAEICEEDPSEWRLNNLLPDRRLTVTKTRAGSTPQRKLIESVVEASDFCRKYSANEMLKKRRGPSKPASGYLRGIGLATCFHGGGFMSDSRTNAASATVRLDAESRLSILSSSAAIPDSAAGMYVDSAARILNLNTSDVHVEPVDTDETPDSGPAVFSRNVTIVRRLIASCCQAIQKQRFRAPLPMEANRNRSGGRGRRWDPSTFTGNPFYPLSWGSCVVEIEVDTVSFDIDLRGVWLTLHLGSVIDEPTAAAVVENELRNTFAACRVHTSNVIPSIRFFQKSGASPGPLEGMASNVFAPALVSAVSQATGFYFDTFPVSKALFLQYTKES